LRENYIFDDVRTPRGKGVAGGALHEVPPPQLAAQLIRALKEWNRLAEDGIDEVILGCATPTGEQNGSLARVAAVMGGFADSVSGLQLNRGGASGLDAVDVAAGKIAMGAAELMIAGGVESMSRVPVGADRGAHGVDPAITFHIPFLPEGVSADLLATLYGVSREDLDGYGMASQHRADFAWSQGFFSGSLVPVIDMLGTELLGRDEAIGADVNTAFFRSLQPASKAMGGTGFDKIAIERFPEVSRDMAANGGSFYGSAEAASAVGDLAGKAASDITGHTIAAYGG
jgi:acetyl-CoA C-acetyltransferase